MKFHIEDDEFNQFYLISLGRNSKMRICYTVRNKTAVFKRIVDFIYEYEKLYC
jgi:hypothetical protein